MPAANEGTSPWDAALSSRNRESRRPSHRELARVFARKDEGQRPILGLLVAGATSAFIWGGILAMLV